MDKTVMEACKKMGHKLYDELEAAGVELTGVGVSLASDKTNPAIAIRLLNQTDLAKVPLTYNGYEVDAVVTGKIVAY